MGEIIDITGQRFGKLTAIRRVDSVWECKCDCGNITYVRISYLKNGHTKSCGCKKFETKNLIHGKSKTRLYNIWDNMKARCYRKYSDKYKWYGERGIKMCDEWLGENGFISFQDWSLSNGYQDNLTIDRIDVNGNYEPNNCRWITQKEQCLNKRDTILFTYNGVTKPLKEWCREFDLKYYTIWKRIYVHHWSFEDAISSPKYTRSKDLMSKTQN